MARRRCYVSWKRKRPRCDICFKDQEVDTPGPERHGRLPVGENGRGNRLQLRVRRAGVEMIGVPHLPRGGSHAGPFRRPVYWTSTSVLLLMSLRLEAVSNERMAKYFFPAGMPSTIIASLVPAACGLGSPVT